MLGVLSHILSGAVGGGLVAFVNYLLTKKENIRQKRESLYGRLRGLRYSVSDACKVHCLALIRFFYINHLWGFMQPLEKREYVDEIRFWQNATEKGKEKRTEELSKLHETLGLIWISFSQSSQLNHLLMPCLDLPEPSVDEPPKSIKTERSLERWEKEITAQMNDEILDNIIQPIELLLLHLERCFKGPGTSPIYIYRHHVESAGVKEGNKNVRKSNIQ
jgi:hypothetical protein